MDGILDRVVVTGGTGLLGQALSKILPGKYLSSKDFDLTNEQSVLSLFEETKPTAIVHLAAKVGGILDNLQNSYDFFTENIKINTNIIDGCRKFNVKRLICILSTCSFPDVCESYPMDLDDFHLGPPAKSNFSYGYAKRAAAVQIDACNEQYETNYQYLIPCNLYGPGDSLDSKKSHFVTSLLYKIKKAKENNEKSITLMGDGTPLRQFLLSDDLATIISLSLKSHIYDNFCIGADNLSIKEMAEIALEVCDASHLSILWDKSKPNGQFRKDVSNEDVRKLFPEWEQTPFKDGLKLTFNKL